MRILALGDCHLKPAMFDQAEAILRSGQAAIAIQMGDLVDDWGEEANIGLYERTLERAIKFHEDFPETLWVLGNHDHGYRHPEYGARETGHSAMAEPFVRPLLEKLPQEVMHIVDGVVFTHAGLTMWWVQKQMDLISYPDSDMDFPDSKTLSRIVNRTSLDELWQEEGPIWVRPQVDEYLRMYPAKLQVVGHTPVGTVTERRGILSVDTWSTTRVGSPIGDRSFAIIDTEKGRWEYAKKM